MKLDPGFFKGRGERARASREATPLPRRVGASLRKGLPLHPRRALKRKEGSSESSPRRDPVASRRRVAPTFQFRNLDRIPFRWVGRPQRKRRFRTRWGPA